MSPPDLAGNTPVFDILQPVQINLVKPVRHKFQFAGLQRIDRRFCQFFHLYKPLLLDQRLYRCAAAVMGSHRMGMGNDFYKKSLLFQIFYDHLSRFIAVHTRIFSAFFIDGGVIVHNVDLFQVVTFAYLKVVRIVSRRDLHRSGSELLIYIIVRHDRDLPADQRQDYIFPDNITISLIIRMYRDRSITEHGFRTGRCDLQEPVSPCDRILDMPEMSLLLLMLHLSVRKGCLAFRTPVDDPGTLVNISFVIQADKHFFYGFGTALVHCKPLSVPVAGYAQLFQLSLDRSRVFFLPLPGSLQESFPSQFLLVNTFLFQLVSNFNFRGNSRVIRPRNPEGIVSFHSFVSDQDILQCVVQRVPHVKLSRNIRRRHYRSKGFSAPVHLCVEIFVLTPFLIQLFFNLFRIVCFCQFSAHTLLLNLPHNLPVCFLFTDSSQFQKKSPLHNL